MTSPTHDSSIKSALAREGLGRSLRMVSDKFIDDQARTATPSADVSGTNAQSDANSEAAANPALVPAQ